MSSCVYDAARYAAMCVCRDPDTHASCVITVIEEFFRLVAIIKFVFRKHYSWMITYSTGLMMQSNQ